MRGIAILLLLALAGCAAVTNSTASAPAEVQDWQTASGKPPTAAEFAALVAACHDRVGATTENGPMVGCLADLGLRQLQ